MVRFNLKFVRNRWIAWSLLQQPLLSGCEDDNGPPQEQGLHALIIVSPEGEWLLGWQRDALPIEVAPWRFWNVNISSWRDAIRDARWKFFLVEQARLFDVPQQWHRIDELYRGLQQLKQECAPQRIGCNSEKFDVVHRCCKVVFDVSIIIIIKWSTVSVSALELRDAIDAISAILISKAMAPIASYEFTNLLAITRDTTEWRHERGFMF